MLYYCSQRSRCVVNLITRIFEIESISPQDHPKPEPLIAMQEEYQDLKEVAWLHHRVIAARYRDQLLLIVVRH